MPGGYIKVPITFPMLFDESNGTIGSTFEAYEASEVVLPSIFLVDQTGIIRIRSDGIAEEEPFLEEMELILNTIDELLNPPGGF
jgi:hypothetical protein